MQSDAGTYLKNKAEAAKFLAVSIGSIERLMRKGLPYVKVGGLVRFRPEDLTGFVRSRMQDRGDKGHVAEHNQAEGTK
jgi:excisionase family DNA binding protein